MELKHIFRNRAILIIILILPIFILLFSTYATPSDKILKNINVAFFNEDYTPISKLLIAFVSSFFKGKSFYTINSQEQMQTLLVEGKVDGVIVIPKKFADSVLHGEPTSLEYIPSVENLQTSLSVYRVLRTLLQEFSYTVFVKNPDVMKEFTQYSSHPMPGLVVRGISEEKFDYPDLMVPGVVSLLVLLIVMMGIGTSITREREKATIEGIILSPVSRSAILLAKIFVYMIVGLIEATVLLIVGQYITSLNIEEKFIEVLVFLLLGMFAYLGVGIFVSTVFKNVEASMMTLFGILFFLALTSSVFIPLEIMPKFVRKICEFSPLTQVVVSLRKVLIANYDISKLKFSVFYLIVFSTIFIVAAIISFKKILK
ncbi:MAG: type transport system permease protein [Thermotogaceae bacterium]|nr:type transport system permease protein [Thermotogaceae bacterium]